MNSKIEAFLNENEAVLSRLTAFMLDYNAHTNLTRITAPDEIREKHYIDSVLPLMVSEHCQLSIVNCKFPIVPRGTSLLDVGSGAGFPGIPMKLLRPDLRVTLLDSARKRTDYLEAVLREIDVECAVVMGRSEELAHSPDYREKFGVVTARAVANLAALCEYCLPFVKPPAGSGQAGGVFLAMKGEDSEHAAAVRAIELLGGEIEAVHEYALPSGDARNLVVIRKVRPTPTAYPRKRVNITKNPML
jgi:16S rRNA (guanine527-N7)-methyltransferase